MKCTVVAGAVADKGLTVVTAAGVTATSTTHTPAVAFVLVVPRVGKVILRGSV